MPCGVSGPRPKPRLKPKRPKPRCKYSSVADIEAVEPSSGLPKPGIVPASMDAESVALHDKAVFCCQSWDLKLLCCSGTIIVLIWLSSPLTSVGQGDRQPLKDVASRLPPAPPRSTASTRYPRTQQLAGATATGAYAVEVITLPLPPRPPPMPKRPCPSPAPPLPSPPPSPKLPTPGFPPPSPPPPPLVDRINARFHRRDGSSQLRDAGILVHMIDGYEDAPALADRFSANVLFAGQSAKRTPERYLGRGGMVLNPEEARALCAYGVPGVSLRKTCQSGSTGTCVPGCMTAEQGPTDGWCDLSASVPSDAECSARPWRPKDLSKLLDTSITSDRQVEIVLDGAHFSSSQPASVDAIFMVPTDPDGGAAARAMHLSFLQSFPTVRRGEFPLLAFHPDDPITPFTVAAEPSQTNPTFPDDMFGSADGVMLVDPAPPPPPPPPRQRPSQTHQQGQPTVSTLRHDYQNMQASQHTLQNQQAYHYSGDIAELGFG